MSTEFFARQSVSFRNDLARGCGALLGIAQGVLADGRLHDKEIEFLADWLNANSSIAAAWPGNVIHARVQEVLADGQVTSEERAHLTELLQQLVGGTSEELSAPTHVSGLALDAIQAVTFRDRLFCLTGDFVFGPRSTCAAAIERRGGLIADNITKKLAYVVVGGMGSPEWKHGSFGTKIEKAMLYKAQGLPIKIVHEDTWAASLSEQLA